MSQLTRLKTNDRQKEAVTPKADSILIKEDSYLDRSRLEELCHTFDFATNVVKADSLKVLENKLKKDGLDLIPLGFTDYATKDEISEGTPSRSALSTLQRSPVTRTMVAKGAPSAIKNETGQGFLHGYAKEIKSIVSQIMRQMRGLRDIDQIRPDDAVARVEQVEKSLRRLGVYLDEQDHQGGATPDQRPTVPTTRGSNSPPASVINASVPTFRPKKPTNLMAKPPSIFRRRPD